MFVTSKLLPNRQTCWCPRLIHWIVNYLTSETIKTYLCSFLLLKFAYFTHYRFSIKLLLCVGQQFFKIWSQITANHFKILLSFLCISFLHGICTKYSWFNIECCAILEHFFDILLSLKGNGHHIFEILLHKSLLVMMYKVKFISKNIMHTVYEHTKVNIW